MPDSNQHSGLAVGDGEQAVARREALAARILAGTTTRADVEWLVDSLDTLAFEKERLEEQLEAAERRRDELQEYLDAILAFLRRDPHEPWETDISDFSDEWCSGFLVGQENAQYVLDRAASTPANKQVDWNAMKHPELRNPASVQVAPEPSGDAEESASSGRPAPDFDPSAGFSSFEDAPEGNDGGRGVEEQSPAMRPEGE